MACKECVVEIYWCWTPSHWFWLLLSNKCNF